MAGSLELADHQYCTLKILLIVHPLFYTCMQFCKVIINQSINHVFSMVHVYNEVANQDSQRKKSLKCKPVDIPVFFWRSVNNIIMVLTKTQNILILKQSLNST